MFTSWRKTRWTPFTFTSGPLCLFVCCICLEADNLNLCYLSPVDAVRNASTKYDNFVSVICVLYDLDSISFCVSGYLDIM